MIDDDNAIEIEFNPPDANIVWEHSLETRRRGGVTSVSREQADKLITEWSEAVAAGLVPPPTH
jgi:hypothetical protein